MASDPSVFGLGSDKTLVNKCHRFLYPVSAILAVLVATVLSGYFSYSVTHIIQVRAFEKEYYSLTRNAVVLLRKGMDEKIQGARALAAVYSGAFPNINRWPFVYLYNFEKIYSTISPATQISFMPVVTPELARDFETFAYHAFNETFDKKTARSRFGIGIFATTNISCFTCPRYHDISGNTTYGSPNQILAPVLQGKSLSLMFNVHSDPLRGTALDKVIDCANNATSSREMDFCGAITTPTFTFIDPSVASIVFFPVYPARNDTSLAGFTVIGIRWNEILNTLFPVTVSGVYAVLRADADIAYTFVLNGGRVERVLSYDAHDAALGSYAVGTSITARDFLQSPVVSYTLTFYPTRTFMRQYVNDNAWYTMLIVVFVVLVIAGAASCGLYFFWMRRKAAETATMSKAKRLFIRYISHEIRTPLNTVSLGLNLLLSEMTESESTLQPPSQQHNNRYNGRGGIMGGRSNGSNGRSNGRGVKSNSIVPSNINSSGVMHNSNRSAQVGTIHTTSIGSHEWHKLVAELIENSQCAVMLLDDLLSFEQLETTPRSDITALPTTDTQNDARTHHPTEVQVLPVWDLVRSAIGSFEVRARLSDVTLLSVVEVDKTDSVERRAAMESLRMLGNEAQLRRVVCSLLSNALQYSHEGGEIHVTTCWIDCDTHRPSKALTNTPVHTTTPHRPHSLHTMPAITTEPTTTPAAPTAQQDTNGEAGNMPLSPRGRLLSRLYAPLTRTPNYTRNDSGSNASSWEGSRTGMVRAGVVRVAVTDQGSGMTAEQTAQVFGKGRRFAINSLQAGQGSGIGLFVCRIIAEQHHATIRVTSPGPGLGSTYLLDLPVFTASPAQDNSDSIRPSEPMQAFLQQPSSPRAYSVKFHALPTVREVEVKSEDNNTNKESKVDTVGSVENGNKGESTTEPPALLFEHKRILVVDDAPSNRKMLIRVLAKNGHRCEQAQDGQVAIDMVDAATDSPYDMILMDYEMPVMNGPTATRLLRERGCMCPIVGVTGNVLSADVEYFVAQGADAVLPKPLQVTALEAIWRKKIEEDEELLQQDLGFEV